MANIELQDSIVARLAAQAKAEGLSLESYLEKLADSRPACILPRPTGEELDRLIDAEASEDSTYQGTYPRADIYLDHD
jgi:hypothetical protein